MSGSLNLVVLVGRVGREVEMRYTAGGDPIANFSLATSERWTKGGEKQERTEWHQVVVFGKTAQFVGSYVQKGSLVLVEGNIRYEEYTDRDGHKRTATKIRASKVELLSGKGDRNERTGPTQEEPQAAFQAEDSDLPF
jgi:single-strand DNA-binding protein